jgi:hypothetical protein
VALKKELAKNGADVDKTKVIVSKKKKAKRAGVE